MKLHIFPSISENTTTRDFQPPMTHVITPLFSLFQSNFVTLPSYHTFVPLLLIMTPSMSHHPTLFRYQPYNWLEYLLTEANQNWNGDSISLNSNPISVASCLYYIHFIAWQYIYMLSEKTKSRNFGQKSS